MQTSLEEIWVLIKEVFFTLGALAGFLALLKPVLEQKHNRDSERCKRIILSIPESLLIDLDFSTWNSRMVGESLLSPIEQVVFEYEKNLDVVRFNGPLASWYTSEIAGLCNTYREYRGFLQVPEWEPVEINKDGKPTQYWKFNKKAYEESPGIMRDYASDLSGAAKKVEVMLHHIQRLQIISEMHLLELPLAKLLLKKRFKTLERRRAS